MSCLYNFLSRCPANFVLKYKAMIIPSGHQAVMPYLLLADAAKFIVFAEKVFNATVRAKHMREDQVTIMHAEIQIAGSTIMFANATEQYKAHPAQLFVYVDQADRCFEEAKAAGGTVVMELSDQDYGRTCGIEDPCGNTWWITSVNKV